MLNNKEERYWSKYTCNYDDVQEYVVGKTVRQEIVKRLNDERDLGEVIEFGCGTGYFTKAIAKNAKQIIATDVSYNMLKMTKRQLKDYKNIDFQIANCKKTDFPDEKFDTVLMVNLLHVIKNPQQALDESYRILKNKGLLITADLTGYGMKKFDMIKLGFRYLRKVGKPPKGAKNNLSPDDLELLAGSAGFVVETSTLLGDRVKAVYFKGRR